MQEAFFLVISTLPAAGGLVERSQGFTSLDLGILRCEIEISRFVPLPRNDRENKVQGQSLKSKVAPQKLNKSFADIFLNSIAKHIHKNYIYPKITS